MNIMKDIIENTIKHIIEELKTPKTYLITDTNKIIEDNFEYIKNQLLTHNITIDRIKNKKYTYVVSNNPTDFIPKRPL